MSQTDFDCVDESISTNILAPPSDINYRGSYQNGGSYQDGGSYQNRSYKGDRSCPGGESSRFIKQSRISHQMKDKRLKNINIPSLDKTLKDTIFGRLYHTAEKNFVSQCKIFENKDFKISLELTYNKKSMMVLFIKHENKTQREIHDYRFEAYPQKNLGWCSMPSGIEILQPQKPFYQMIMLRMLGPSNASLNKFFVQHWDLSLNEYQVTDIPMPKNMTDIMSKCPKNTHLHKEIPKMLKRLSSIKTLNTLRLLKNKRKINVKSDKQDLDFKNEKENDVVSKKSTLPYHTHNHSHSHNNYNHTTTNIMFVANNVEGGVYFS